MASKISDLPAAAVAAPTMKIEVETTAPASEYVEVGMIAVPVGVALPWLKTLTGTPALPANFVECNGQTISDANSPFDTVTIPDLNGGNRFLRGNATSGGTGGAATHTHDIDIDGSYGGVVVGGAGSGYALDADPDVTEAGSSLPPYYNVVWIMRIK